nr:unnamed protein product [Callosobruchus chinensis]
MIHCFQSAIHPGSQMSVVRWSCGSIREFGVMLDHTVAQDEASGFEPDFLYPLENVTVAQGRDATFTCVVNNLGGYRVSRGLQKIN